MGARIGFRPGLKRAPIDLKRPKLLLDFPQHFCIESAPGM
jgi:hypothetical protein